MKSRATLLVSAIVAGLGVGFWLYGIGRTMRENVNFDTTASLSGLLLGVGLPLVVLLPTLIVKKVWFPEKAWPMSSLLAAFAVALLAGSLASEWWILRDEARFSVEASKTNGGTPYSRSRAWPNQTCSLVFVPGKGIHATD
jgi:hypothetical protein